MVKQTIEYGVRAVTRYIVTKHRSGEGVPESTGEVAEVDTLTKANLIAEAMAGREPYGSDNPDVAVKVNLLHEPPGRVMRCKVKLGSRQVALGYAPTNSEGKYPGRTVTIGEGERAYQSPDLTDPANFRPDGEQLTFYAVTAGFASDGTANVEENRIFGHWSPQVEFKATVRNPDVLRNLGEAGEEFYVDFIRAPKAVDAA